MGTQKMAKKTVLHGGLGVGLPAAEHVAAAAERGELQVVSIQFSPERSGLAVNFAKGGNPRDKSLVDGTRKAESLGLGAAKLSQVLCSCLRQETLKELELVGLRLSLEFYRTLDKGLLSNSSLKVLCLNDTDVGDKGVSLLLAGIGNHPFLSRLQICNCCISDSGGREVVEMLRQQAERLSLASWRHSLRTAVSKTEVDRGLKVVALSYNSLGEATLSLLASVLSLDSSLREVYLRGSCLSSKTSDQLQATLSDNLTIQTVDLRDPGEGSAVGGWLWDATQDPPLIMQNFLPPRPLALFTSTKDDQRRRVDITGAVAGAKEAVATTSAARPHSAPSLSAKAPSKHDPARVGSIGRQAIGGGGGGRGGKCSGEARLKAHAGESAMDPRVSWATGLQDNGEAGMVGARKAHSTGDVLTRSVILGEGAVQRAGGDGGSGGGFLRRRSGADGDAEGRERVGEGRVMKAKAVVSGEQLEGSKTGRAGWGGVTANGGSEGRAAKRGIHAASASSKSKEVEREEKNRGLREQRGTRWIHGDEVISALVKDLKLLVASAPDDSKSQCEKIERRSSCGDGVTSFLEQAHSRRPIRHSHAVADALIDAVPSTVMTVGNSRDTREVGLGTNGEKVELGELIGKLRESLKIQVIARQRAEAKNLDLVVENAELRRRLAGKGAVASADETGKGAGRKQGRDIREEEKLLLQLEQTIYFLSDKVRELEEGGNSNDLDEHSLHKGSAASVLVAQRLKQMWGST